MDKVYQVFVSSTYSDLKDERRRVSDTLAKAGFISAGMELFPAADQQQFDFIKRVIDRCDYYVVIVGGRYGSLADEKISFTEMEYEYARERGIPVLAFLHRNPENITVGKTDQNEEKAKRLKRFRDNLATGRMVDFWTDANDLCTTVTIAVMNAANLTPGTGWVRGDQAVDPAVLQELERLRIENNELKKRSSELLSGELTFPSQLAGPDDNFDFEIIEVPFGQKGASTAGSWKFREVFEELSEELITEKAEYAMGRHLASTYLKQKGMVGSNDCRLAPHSLRTLRFHLEALGLIQAVGRKEIIDAGGLNITQDYVAWSITDKGRKFISTLGAVKKGP